MEHFGAPGRHSSYGAADLPGQDCNCCFSMGSVPAHLSATPGDLHPLQHSCRAGSTLWPHSLLHHDTTEHIVPASQCQGPDGILNNIIIDLVTAVNVIPG